MQFLRISLWCSGLLTSIAILAYGSLLLINWRDDPASPAARHLAHAYASRPAVEDRDNAYLYLMGFTTAEGHSPVEQGRQRVEWMIWASEHWVEDLSEPELPRWTDPGDTRPLFVAPLLDACNTNNSQCLSRLLSHERRLDEWLRTESLLLERYQELIGLQAMREPLPFDMRFHFPEYHHVLEGQRLLLVHAWQLARRGEPQKAQALLQADLSFWRMAQANADVLIGRMVAGNAIRQHFLWVTQISRGASTTVPIPASWQQPLNDSERNWTRTLGGELAFIEGYLHQLKRGELEWLANHDEDSPLQQLTKLLAPPLLLSQAAQNQHAELLLAQQRLFSAPYATLISAKANSLALEDAHRIEQLGITDLRNLGGNLLRMQASKSSFTDYYLRITDLEGLRRASLLIAEMRERQLAPAQVADHVQRSALQDPYREAPFGWEAATSTLLFEGLSENGNYRLAY